MQWEIILGVIIAIGIFTAVLETRAKRSARKKETDGMIAEQGPAMGESKKRRK